MKHHTHKSAYVKPYSLYSNMALWSSGKALAVTRGGRWGRRSPP